MEPKDQSSSSKASSESHSRSTGSNPKSGPYLKLILALTAIFIVLIAILALTRTSNKSTNNPLVSTNLAAQVIITNKGFLPSVIRVKVDTTVTWTNRDTKVHQVAADPYPKNDSIPGMDSSVILNKSDTLSFSFSKTGTYTYHDQRNPLSKRYHGTVIVE